MTDYDCKTNGHHWIDHPEDGRFCFYCDEKYDFVQLYNRIEKLEAALRSYVCNCTTEICDDCLTSTECGYRARKALEGKDD